MADWDAESSTLQQNLVRTLRGIRDSAALRGAVRARDAATWHRDIMDGLEVPKPEYVGTFRGDPGMEEVRVLVGPHEGVPPDQVLDSVVSFERKLNQVLARLDSLIPAGAALNTDTLAAVLDVCGWAHAEWVRIHPFVNGNGRTARLWANYVAMRYGLPPFVRLRPRPEADAYARAGGEAMDGNWKPTAEVFRVMLRGFL
jgi:fido (protein-threonine AMPylation protein)